MLKHHSYKTAVFTLLAACIFTLSYCSSSETKVETPKEEPVLAGTPVSRGAKLVHLGGCTDCHSPKVMTPMGPVPDTTRLYSGHPAGAVLPPITYDATKPGNWVLLTGDLTAAVGPWGITYAANLTPDSTTGLGSWTVENFIKSMKTGKHLGQEGGRPILPPMPWPTLAALSEQELSDMFAYFKSLPAIKNQVPAPVPPGEVMLKK